MNWQDLKPNVQALLRHWPDGGNGAIGLSNCATTGAMAGVTDIQTVFCMTDMLGQEMIYQSSTGYYALTNIGRVMRTFMLQADQDDNSAGGHA